MIDMIGILLEGVINGHPGALLALGLMLAPPLLVITAPWSFAITLTIWFVEFVKS